MIPMSLSAKQLIRYSSMGERTEPPVITDLMSRVLENRELLSLAAGFTDNEILPGELVRKAVEALDGSDSEHLQYGLNQGRPGLRDEVCSWLTQYPGEKEGVFDPAAVMITNGSQQCLYLAMQMLCDPGDFVLVERPTYFVFLEMLKGLGITPLGMPSKPEGGGVDPDGTRELIKELRDSGKINRLKAAYLVSYYSNPSSRCLPESDKAGLVRLLEEEDLCIPLLEDAAYRDLYFDSPCPARTLFSLAECDAFPKLYLGTFTKPLATGMKIGYGVCSDPELRSRMLSTKGHQDFGSSNFCQAIVEYIMEQGWYGEYLRGQRKHYRSKAVKMHELLVAGGLPEAGWSWEQPEGGLLMWLRGPDDLDTRIGSPFCEACIRRGVLYVPGDLSLTGYHPVNYVRLSYGALPLKSLEEATRRFIEVAVEFS